MFLHVKKPHICVCVISFFLSSWTFTTDGAQADSAELQCSDQSGLKIAEILDDLERVKENREYEDLPSFWDQSDEAPFYIAEEITDVMTDWPTVEAYWQGTKASSGWIDVEYDLITQKCLGPKDMLILFDLRWDMSVDGFDNPIGGSNRVVAGLRLVEQDWKFHTWVEAPLAALIYMEQLYEKNVRPEVLQERADTE